MCKQNEVLIAENDHARVLITKNSHMGDQQATMRKHSERLAAENKWIRAQTGGSGLDRVPHRHGDILGKAINASINPSLLAITKATNTSDDERLDPRRMLCDTTCNASSKSA
jgi:hypothetical protein